MRNRGTWRASIALAAATFAGVWLTAGMARASEGGAQVHGPELFGVPIEFVLFGMTLIGVALFHKQTFYVALTGLAAILTLKLGFCHGFDLVGHLKHEWQILLNLFGLLLGFALLAKHFEDSRIPAKLPDFLPDDWKGGFVLLLVVAVLSSFLDNIAAAMIGGTMARVVFKRKVHMGFLVAIVAASNAGGAGSVVGDTTTTMMWIDGVGALDVVEASLGSLAAVAFFAYFAARQQDGYQRIQKDADLDVKIDWVRVFIVAIILAGAITTNVLLDFPAAGVWVAILIGALLRKTDWREIPGSLKGTIFLLSLVLCASLMPVDRLPAASWHTALGLGVVSAIFDNIPLTKLALCQGGYDWGFLAYAVGFGGSMVWFGSSAGVALTNGFPEARSVGTWVKHGWHVVVAYFLGFFVMLLVLGWHPHAPHRKGAAPHASPAATSSAVVAPATAPAP